MSNHQSIMTDIGYHSFEAAPFSTMLPLNVARDIHVLLVEYDHKDYDRAINMLQYFSYKVTPTKLASTALSMLSKGKVHFDVLMVNMNSPDLYGFQLLYDAIKMNLLVILMLDDNDGITTMRVLEQGAFLCIKKPLTLEIIRYLWQHVSRQKIRRLRRNERLREGIGYNTSHREFGKDLIEGHPKGNSNTEDKYKSKKKVKSVSSQDDNVMFKQKVWTEWTLELHEKFMNAVAQLGEGRCFPRDILELMNVPGLTRMQVASHLQKCRNANWMPPNERKSRQPNAEKTPPNFKIPRAKTLRFGCMPPLDSSQSNVKIQNYEENHQESSTDPPTKTSIMEDNHEGSSDKGHHPQLLLDHNNYPFAQGNETFNMGQFGQTFCIDESFTYGTQNVTQATTYTTSSQGDFTKNPFEFPNLDTMVQNFSSSEQEWGIDYNGSLQSIVLDLYHNQVSNVTNAAHQWSQEAPKPVNNEENEGQMKEG